MSFVRWDTKGEKPIRQGHGRGGDRCRGAIARQGSARRSSVVSPFPVDLGAQRRAPGAYPGHPIATVRGRVIKVAGRSRQGAIARARGAGVTSIVRAFVPGFRAGTAEEPPRNRAVFTPVPGA